MSSPPSKAQGFPKHRRLLRPADYARVLKAPELRKGRGPLQVLACRNNIPAARLGLIVPKRAIAQAHDRNRIKRVVRETFRVRAERFEALDLILRVRGPVSEPGLQHDLKWLFDWIEEQ